MLHGRRPLRATRNLESRRYTLQKKGRKQLFYHERESVTQVADQYYCLVRVGIVLSYAFEYISLYI